MTEIDPAKRTEGATLPLPVLPRDNAPHDPHEGRTLYVLGFGVAGAILANAIVLIYFASLYASG
jgi:hypothetical protein